VDGTEQTRTIEPFVLWYAWQQCRIATFRWQMELTGVLPTSVVRRWPTTCFGSRKRDLSLAHSDGRFTNLMARFAKLDPIILDDWELAKLTAERPRDVL
jgi:hypothetical protein